MDRAARFWDKVAERYSKRPVADEATYAKKLQVTREHFRPDMQVLEFGCGTGSTAISHAPYVKHILATDLSSRMIEIARERASADSVNNVTFEQSSIDGFDRPAQYFDAVLALNVLHLVQDKDAAIARVHQLLKPGGVFVSSTACVADMMFLLKFIAPIGAALRLFPPVSVFTSEELKRALVHTGFEIEHEWLPGRNKAVFIVARKTGDNGVPHSQ